MPEQDIIGNTCMHLFARVHTQTLVLLSFSFAQTHNTFERNASHKHTHRTSSFLAHSDSGNSGWSCASFPDVKSCSFSEIILRNLFSMQTMLRRLRREIFANSRYEQAHVRKQYLIRLTKQIFAGLFKVVALSSVLRIPPR